MWRVAFAFDPTRSAILLVAADKAGVKERRTDMLLSTLDEHVRAMGGQLELNVEFPGHRKVRLKTLHEPKEGNEVAAQ